MRNMREVAEPQARQGIYLGALRLARKPGAREQDHDAGPTSRTRI